MATNDIRLVRGDSRRARVDLSIVNPATGKPIPYTVSAGTHEVVFTCKRHADDAGIALQRRLSNGGILVDPSVHSRVYVVFGADSTAGMVGTYYYDIQVTEFATGDKVTPVIARATFVADMSA